MKLDWTLSIGNVITAGVLLLAFVKAHLQNIRKLQDIEIKVGMMYSWFSQHVINGTKQERGNL